MHIIFALLGILIAHAERDLGLVVTSHSLATSQPPSPLVFIQTSRFKAIVSTLM